MLTRNSDGLFIDKFGFIAAMMLKWNTSLDGIAHYIFLRQPFDPIPFDIVSNGIDNSVLISKDMFEILLEKKVVRSLTEEEAASVNSNVIELNEENAQNETKVRQQIDEENSKSAATENSHQIAPKVPSSVGNVVTSQQDVTAAKVATVGKKGK